MFKGIKLVIVVMAVMVLIGTMMTPAHADYERTTTFEEKFEVLFDLYLEREELEDYFVIESIKEIDMNSEVAHAIVLRTTDKGNERIIEDEGYESNNVYGLVYMVIFSDRSFMIIARTYVDGVLYDMDEASGENILEQLDLI